MKGNSNVLLNWVAESGNLKNCPPEVVGDLRNYLKYETSWLLYFDIDNLPDRNRFSWSTHFLDPSIQFLR